MRADLHIHSYYSDGLMPPAEIASEAVRAGVKLICITDHDCALAYEEICKIAHERNLATVSGIEISAYSDGVKIHTLGYNFDPHCEAFIKFCKELYDGAQRRAEEIIYKLNKNGIKLSFDEVLKKRTSENSPVHAMYIARAAAEKYGGGNAFAFYKQYLAGGKCAYSEISRPSPETAIEVIHASGGFASLAHPARIELSRDGISDLVKRLKACGLDGIEGVYSTHTPIETAYYKEMANTFGLVVTGGSDTHFKGGNKKIGSPLFFAEGELARKLGI